MTTTDLETQAREFAERITSTVRALVPDADGFDAVLLTDRRPDRERFWVRQDPVGGIPLAVNGQPILTMKVEYHCCLDGQDHWMAVDEAQVKVYAGAQASKEPLFRYHYLRQGAADLPAAHIHVHAHRDALSHVLGKTGSQTARGKARARADEIPRMPDLHFPVGGHRFRPCLEDVLEMLVTELGVDHPDGAIEALREGRETWRRSQVRTVVRDAPEEAITVLQALGYVVTLQESREVPEGNPDRLQEF